MHPATDRLQERREHHPHRSGSPAACTFRCQESARTCGPADGACPAGCGRDPDCLPRPSSCTRIEWCVKPFQPNQGKVICITNVDGRCTDAERRAECAREATNVCGGGRCALHALTHA